VIAADTLVEGFTRAPGVTVMVDGVHRGNIEDAYMVYVGVGGLVVGSVTATEVVVAGKIEGDVVARERCEVHDTGTVAGGVQAGTLLCLEGASVLGRLRVGSASSADTRRGGHDERSSGTKVELLQRPRTPLRVSGD
jgi:cytoskeletal protein CcmA (bactofilin family)